MRRAIDSHGTRTAGVLSDLVVAAPGDEAPHPPALVHLLVVAVPVRADADPLPRIILDKVVEAP